MSESERVAKLEQALHDHLESCDKFRIEMSGQFKCVRKQLGVIEKKFDDRSWSITKWLLITSFGLVVTLASYIWVEEKTAEEQAKNVSGTDSPHLPGVYPLQRK